MKFQWYQLAITYIQLFDTYGVSGFPTEWTMSFRQSLELIVIRMEHLHMMRERTEDICHNCTVHTCMKDIE